MTRKVAHLSLENPEKKKEYLVHYYIPNTTQPNQTTLKQQFQNALVGAEVKATNYLTVHSYFITLTVSIAVGDALIQPSFEFTENQQKYEFVWGCKSNEVKMDIPGNDISNCDSITESSNDNSEDKYEDMIDKTDSTIALTCKWTKLKVSTVKSPPTKFEVTFDQLIGIGYICGYKGTNTGKPCRRIRKNNIGIPCKDHKF